MKKCFKCNQIKSLSEFYEHSQMGDGHLNKCKECTKKDTQENYQKRKDYYIQYNKHRQRYSLNRMFLHRYGNMRQRVEGRATRKYKIEGKEICSKEEFLKWCYQGENLLRFNMLYNFWKENDFTRKFTPSIDRIDNNRGYALNNLQWLTQKENVIKYTK